MIAIGGPLRPDGYDRFAAMEARHELGQYVEAAVAVAGLVAGRSKKKKARAHESRIKDRIRRQTAQLKAAGYTDVEIAGIFAWARDFDPKGEGALTPGGEAAVFRALGLPEPEQRAQMIAVGPSAARPAVALPTIARPVQLPAPIRPMGTAPLPSLLPSPVITAQPAMIFPARPAVEPVAPTAPVEMYPAEYAVPTPAQPGLILTSAPSAAAPELLPELLPSPTAPIPARPAVAGFGSGGLLLAAGVGLALIALSPSKPVKRRRRR